MVSGMNKKMCASIAEILANLCLKEHEPALLKEVPKLTVLNEDNKEVCPGCQKRRHIELKE